MGYLYLQQLMVVLLVFILILIRISQEHLQCQNTTVKLYFVPIFVFPLFKCKTIFKEIQKIFESKSNLMHYSLIYPSCPVQGWTGVPPSYHKVRENWGAPWTGWQSATRLMHTDRQPFMLTFIPTVKLESHILLISKKEQ